MTGTKFETLVTRLKGEAHRASDRYGRRVLLLVFYGDAYITAILLLSLTLTLLVASIVAVTEATLLAIKFLKFNQYLTVSLRLFSDRGIVFQGISSMTNG